MEKWYVKLSQFHIEYEPRTAIKGQVLADFIAESTETPTGPTRGHNETIVAPVGQPSTSTRGKKVQI